MEQGHKKFSLGAMEITILSDGPLMVPVKILSFQGVSPSELSQKFVDNGYDPDLVPMHQNAVVMRHGADLVLFDTGMGHYPHQGPRCGRLLANMAEAGISKQDITAVCISHGHSDHCWGLLDAQGNENFPNARIYMEESDFRHWTDPARGQDPRHADQAEITRQSLMAVAHKMSFYGDGAEILPGVATRLVPGHSPGHTVFVLQSEGQKLALIADLAHYEFIELQNPQIISLRDPNPAQAAQSRAAVFASLAADSTEFIGYHLPWPGHGRLVTKGDGYKFIAA